MPAIRRTYAYLDSNGELQQKRITAGSNAEADLAFQKFLKEINTHSSRTFQTFIDEVYRPTFMVNLRETTQSMYEYFLKKYLYPNFGDKEMNAITVADVQRFQNWLADCHVSGLRQNINANSINRICGVAKKVFSIAEELGEIDRSPFHSKLLKNPGQEGGHHKALPNDVYMNAIQAIPSIGHPLHQLYGALLITGMRREEILGLRWEDTHLEEQYLIVNRACVYPHGNQPVLQAPKTKSSHRTVYLSTLLISVLRKHQKPDGYLFNGEKLMAYSTAQRMVNQTLEELGAKGYTSHDFRSTRATLLKESGLTSIQVADILGQADSRMVEKVYAPTRHQSVMMHGGTIEAIEAIDKPQKC